MSHWRGLTLGFALLLGGAYLLAFTGVTRVFEDPRRFELGTAHGDTIGDPTYVFLSSILMTAGLATTLGTVTPTVGWRRAAAIGVLSLSTFLLLPLHLTLFINSLTISQNGEVASRFSASYLFHTSSEYSLMAVFILFLITIALLSAFVTSVGFLVGGQRFLRAVWDARDWAKNEAHVVASSLLLVFGLALFLLYLGQIAVQLGIDPPAQNSFFAHNLLWFYYLQIFFLALLILTIAARVFLINWGTRSPMDPDTVRDSLDNITRVERVLVGAALLFNVLILAGPAATDEEGLSTDPVFRIDSRGLAWFLFFLALPYIPYALGLRRLRELLERRPEAGPPFSPWSLRLVLVHLLGLVLLAVVGSGAGWGALASMIAFAAWTAAVFLYGSVSLHLDRGLIEPSFRGAGSPPLFLAFLIVGLATGLMMWGAGNTYEAVFLNASVFPAEASSANGADILFRVAGAGLLSFCLLFGLALAKSSLGVKRSQALPYLVSFLSLVALGMIVFSVNVWSNNQSVSDAYAGFSFHQYYTEEKIMVAVLLAFIGALLFWGLSRIVGHLLRPRPGTMFYPTVRVR